MSDLYSEHQKGVDKSIWICIWILFTGFVGAAFGLYKLVSWLLR